MQCLAKHEAQENFLSPLSMIQLLRFGMTGRRTEPPNQNLFKKNSRNIITLLVP